jgi:ribonuclease-3
MSEAPSGKAGFRLNGEGDEIAAQDAALAALSIKLGHSFTQSALLSEALNHRSYLNEAGKPELVSNERLEFLGDAVLGLISADLLFRELPLGSEGDLTEHRAALVRASTLAAFARGIGLGAYLRVGRSEETTGGRDKVPLLASGFEAVVGALYLDGGVDAARHFVEPLLRAELTHITARPRIKDDKSLLQELAQGRLGLTPRYRVIAESGPSHDRTFEVEVVLGEFAAARGHGHSKREAERAAAHAALLDQGWLEAL